MDRNHLILSAAKSYAYGMPPRSRMQLICAFQAGADWADKNPEKGEAK